MLVLPFWRIGVGLKGGEVGMRLKCSATGVAIELGSVSREWVEVGKMLLSSSLCR